AIGFGTGSVEGDVLIQLPAESLGAWNGANCMAACIPLALLPSEPFSTRAALRATRVMLRLVPQRNRVLASPSRLTRALERLKSEPISMPCCRVKLPLIR